jgi:hypothetical protein
MSEKSILSSKDQLCHTSYNPLIKMLYHEIKKEPVSSAVAAVLIRQPKDNPTGSVQWVKELPHKQVVAGRFLSFEAPLHICIIDSSDPVHPSCTCNLPKLPSALFLEGVQRSSLSVSPFQISLNIVSAQS